MNNEPNSLLWLVPLFPLLGFILCGLIGRFRDKTADTGAHDSDHDHYTVPASQKLAGVIATFAVTAAFALSAYLVFGVLGTSGGGENRIFSPRVEWMIAPSVDRNLPGFFVAFGLFLDSLNGLMILIITGVGALIHLYSIGYMSHDRYYARYFEYLNLFVFFMLVLVMGSNLPMLFIGWEGVGLASYLLIGFWFTRQSATDAGKKAFIVNRIGDCALLIALFALYKYFGTLELYGPSGILTEAGRTFAQGRGYELDTLFGIAITAAVPLLLLLGATGKSAQLPLFVWLPDAMEGPTPVSALIHAATMVTGGVYLICRMHGLFLMSDEVMTIVAVVGISTAVVGATIALTQNDIKRVLAYSTVSQLGYMFLACGVGAFGAAMFHVTTHAFFKALLFLGAGSVIHAMAGEQDMRRMGGLQKYLPTTFATMLIGTLAIAGIPPLAGFWSKDEILFNAFGNLGHPFLWFTGLVVSALTAFYMTRMMMKTFAGGRRFNDKVASQVHESPASMTLPLVVLAILSVVGGFLNTPFFGLHLSHFLGTTVEWANHGGEAHGSEHGSLELILLGISAAVALAVVAFTIVLYRNTTNGNLSTQAKMSANPVWALFDDHWGIDRSYNDFFAEGGLRFSRFLSRFIDRRVLEGATTGAGGLFTAISSVFGRWQSGYVRNYALGMLIGVVVIVLSLVGWTTFR